MTRFAPYAAVVLALALWVPASSLAAPPSAASSGKAVVAQRVATVHKQLDSQKTHNRTLHKQLKTLTKQQLDGKQRLHRADTSIARLRKELEQLRAAAPAQKR